MPNIHEDHHCGENCDIQNEYWFGSNTCCCQPSSPEKPHYHKTICINISDLPVLSEELGALDSMIILHDNVVYQVHWSELATQILNNIDITQDITNIINDTIELSEENDVVRIKVAENGPYFIYSKSYIDSQLTSIDTRIDNIETSITNINNEIANIDVSWPSVTGKPFASVSEYGFNLNGGNMLSLNLLNNQALYYTGVDGKQLAVKTSPTGAIWSAGSDGLYVKTGPGLTVDQGPNELKVDTSWLNTTINNNISNGIIKTIEFEGRPAVTTIDGWNLYNGFKISTGTGATAQLGAGKLAFNDLAEGNDGRHGPLKIYPTLGGLYMDITNNLRYTVYGGSGDVHVQLDVNTDYMNNDQYVDHPVYVYPDGPWGELTYGKVQHIQVMAESESLDDRMNWTGSFMTAIRNNPDDRFNKTLFIII